MQAYISAKNNKEMIVLPYLIEEPEITQEQKNEDFGDLGIIGKLDRKRLSLLALLPIKPRRTMAKGSKADPQYYIDWINRLRGEGIPLRLILVNRDGTEHLNMAILIDNFNHVSLKMGDVRIQLDISEFRFANIKAV